MSLTPEELAAIEYYAQQQQLMNDPVAASFNEYGQGADYLGLEDKPDSWSRLGNMNDLLSDRFRMTQSYLQDYIPGLPQEVEDPGAYEGFRPDNAGLYQNNPAVDAVAQLMGTGMSFDEAVNAVADRAAPSAPSQDQQFVDGQLQDMAPTEGIAGVPLDENGRPDLEAFRTRASQAIESGAQYDREYGDWAAKAADYEEYTRPRSNLDFLGVATPNVQSVGTDDEQAYLDYVNKTQTFHGRTDPNAGPGFDGAMDDQMSRLGPPGRSGPSRGGRRGGSQGNGVSVRPTRTLADRPGSVKSRVQQSPDKDVVKYLTAKYANEGNAEVARRWNQRAASTPRESQEQERLRKLNAAYNVIHYGGG